MTSRELPLAVEEVERLRSMGFVIVPIQPTEDMLKIGAPSCFDAYRGSDPQTWENALSDARECYRAMVDVGCL